MPNSAWSSSAVREDVRCATLRAQSQAERNQGKAPQGNNKPTDEYTLTSVYRQTGNETTNGKLGGPRKHINTVTTVYGANNTMSCSTADGKEGTEEKEGNVQNREAPQPSGGEAILHEAQNPLVSILIAPSPPQTREPSDGSGNLEGWCEHVRQNRPANRAGDEAVLPLCPVCAWKHRLKTDLPAVSPILATSV